MIKIKIENPVEDYIGFVDALHEKFNFKNKKAFEKDLFELITSMELKTGKVELQGAEDNFFQLIREHAIDYELEKNFNKAQEEIRNIQKWQLK